MEFVEQFWPKSLSRPELFAVTQQCVISTQLYCSSATFATDVFTTV